MAGGAGWIDSKNADRSPLCFCPPALRPIPALSADPIVKGPEHGALVIVGGGKVGADILGRMFDLAGGKDAPLVVIPTANGAGRVPGRLVGAEDVQGLRCDEHHRCCTRRIERSPIPRRSCVRLRRRRSSGSSEAGSGGWSTPMPTRGRSARSSACSSATVWSPGRRPARRSCRRTWSAARAKTTSS